MTLPPPRSAVIALCVFPFPSLTRCIDAESALRAFPEPLPHHPLPPAPPPPFQLQVLRQDSWVVVHIDSLQQPGKQREGTRLTLVKVQGTKGNRGKGEGQEGQGARGAERNRRGKGQQGQGARWRDKGRGARGAGGDRRGKGQQGSKGQGTGGAREGGQGGQGGDRADRAEGRRVLLCARSVGPLAPDNARGGGICRGDESGMGEGPEGRTYYK